MIREAEEFADEDKKIKDRVDAKNSLESFLYNLKNTLDDDQGIASKIDPVEKDELVSLIDESLDWMDENQDEEADMYTARQKEVEAISNPLMRKVYGSSAGASGSDGGDDEGDFDGYEDNEL
jgi:heat shock protein 5